MPDGIEHLDLSSLRLKLAGAQGKRYWRSLEEVAGTPEFEEMLHREFPREASEWVDGLSRRRFLKVMAASLALVAWRCSVRQAPGSATGGTVASPRFPDPD